MSEFLYIFHWVVMIAFGICGVWVIFGKPHPLARVYIAAILLSQVVRDGCVLLDLQNYFWMESGLMPVENHMITADISTDPMWLTATRILFLYISYELLKEFNNEILGKQQKRMVLDRRPSRDVGGSTVLSR